MGRLFDAVASLLDVRHVVAYEAQAAIELEGLSRDAQIGSTAYVFAVDASQLPSVIDPAPVLRAIVGDLRSGVPVGVIGARFHHAVASLIVDLAEINDAQMRAIALSGGVFQNALLLRQVVKRLQGKGFDVITHRHVPPNDGGIALGQLLVGNAG